MRERFASLSLAIGVAIGLSSCGGPAPEPAAPGGPAGGDLKLEAVVLEQKTGNCGNLGKTDCAAIRLEYPKVTAASPAEAKAKIDSAIRDWMIRPIEEGKTADSPQAIVEQFLAGYRDLLEKEKNYGTPWAMERTIRVEHQAPNVLSLSLTENSSTGGAHPNSVTVYWNFRPATGERIQLRDILKDGALADLTAYGEKEFRDLKRIGANASLESAGFRFKDNHFALNDNFSIGISGLLFHYNAYDIAPYALGPTDLKLPYDDIKQWLRDDAGVL